MKNKIIYITDPEILAINIIESREPLIDLKNQTDIAFGEPPECELTQNDYTKIRQSVYEKICAAQKMLPKNYRFKVYEGYRSLAVQKILFDEVYANVVKRFPKADLKTLFHETTRLASPVINFDGTKNIPAHNTGGAIDIEIIDENGDFMDMGMTAKEWNAVDPELCMMKCDDISKQAQENRTLLLTVMQSQGFVNYPTEWWHFSYGDRYWAYHQMQSHAIYGSADCLFNA